MITTLSATFRRTAIQRLGRVSILIATARLALGPVALAPGGVRNETAKPAIASQQTVHDPDTMTPADSEALRSAPSLVGPLSAAAIALGRADVRAAGGVLSTNQLKGDVAEALVNDAILRRQGEGTGWQMIRPRVGSNGLDGVLIRFDSDGHPRQLLLAETKFNTAGLGQTRDGVQMGLRWRQRRLSALSSRYEVFAAEWSAGRVRLFGPPPMLSPHERLDIPLPGRRCSVGWRLPDGRWNLHVAGGDQEVAVLVRWVPQQLQRMTSFLAATADGRLPYTARIFQLTPDEGALRVTARDCRPLESGVNLLAQLPVVDRFAIALPLAEGIGGQEGRLVGVVRREIAKTLVRRMPHLSEAEVLYLADSLTDRGVRVVLQPAGRMLGAGRLYGVSATGVSTGLLAALVDPAFGVAAGWLHDGRLHLDPTQMARSAGLAFVSTATGTAVGEATVICVTRNAILHQFARSASSALGLPATSIFTNAAGEVAAGGVASVAYALIAYEMGWMDATSARRSAVVGVAASVAGIAACAGGIALISAYGTASTGVAISSLSGAAATSASLAWLGGGSAAAGGGGVALGSMVATGGTALVVIALGGAVAYAFHYHDEAKEAERVRLSIEDLRKHPDFTGDWPGTKAGSVLRE